MPVETIYEIPKCLEAGTTAIIAIPAPAEFPTASWSMAFVLGLNGLSKLNVTATEANGIFTFTLSAAQTAACGQGDYDWGLIATETSSGQKALYRTGCLQILPSLLGNTITSAQARLNALQTAIESISADPYSSVSFNGQSYTSRNLAELRQELVAAQAEVYRERQRVIAARGGNTSPCAQVRFR